MFQSCGWWLVFLVLSACSGWWVWYSWRQLARTNKMRCSLFQLLLAPPSAPLLASSPRRAPGVTRSPRRPLRRSAWLLPLLIWLAVFAALARGQELTLPAEVKGQPGAFVAVAAQTKGKTVKWFTPDPGLNVFPAHLLKDTKTTVVTALRPGSYRLYAYSAIGSEPTDPALCLVVISDGLPPDPKPEPKPEPPAPPTLAAYLKLALAKDGDTTANRAALGQMAKVADLLAKEVAAWKGKTSSQAALLWSDSVRNTLGLQVLYVRKAANDWMEGRVSWSMNAVMTDAQAAELAGLFLELAAALREAGA